MGEDKASLRYTTFGPFTEPHAHFQESIRSVFLAGIEGADTTGPDQKHITDAQSSVSCDPDCRACYSFLSDPPHLSLYLSLSHTHTHTHSVSNDSSVIVNWCWSGVAVVWQGLIWQQSQLKGFYPAW